MSMNYKMTGKEQSENENSMLGEGNVVFSNVKFYFKFILILFYTKNKYYKELFCTWSKF